MTDSQEKQGSNSNIAQILSSNPELGESLDADVWVYSGPLVKQGQRRVLELCSRDDKRPNATLILSTYGGSPHNAYRIGRYFQHSYKKLIVCIAGPCMSAGTLLALAAHELVIGDAGTLGPLDVQLPKEDDLQQRTSGLAVREAAMGLLTEALSVFYTTLEDLTDKSRGRIALRTATESASSLTAKLFQPLLDQIDPLRLAVDTRSMRMVAEYGKRLAKRSENLKPDGLIELISGYPAHEFEIDREEAAERLFSSVRKPSGAELGLLEHLNPWLEIPQVTPLVQVFSTGMMCSGETSHEKRKDPSAASDREDARDQEAHRSPLPSDQTVRPVHSAEPSRHETDKIH